GARKLFDEALRMDEARGAPENAADIHEQLARLDLVEREAVAAEAHVRKGLALLPKKGEEDAECRMSLLLVDVLLAQNAPSRAKEELKRAEPKVAATKNVEIKTEAELLRGRVAAADGRVDEARRSLRSAVMRATATGYGRVLLEARIHLARLDLRGNASGARPELAAVRVAAEKH